MTVLRQSKKQYYPPVSEVLIIQAEGLMAISDKPEMSDDPVYPSSGFGKEQQW